MSVNSQFLAPFYGQFLHAKQILCHILSALIERQETGNVAVQF